MLADTGYATGDEVAELERRGMEVLVATRGDVRRKPHDFRPIQEPKPVIEPKLEWLKAMKAKLEGAAARAKYKLRKQTVEPVFGIIKQVLGFRQFLLRGIANVRLEWSLVTLAYNMKRLHRLMATARAA